MSIRISIRYCSRPAARAAGTLLAACLLAPCLAAAQGPAPRRPAPSPPQSPEMARLEEEVARRIDAAREREKLPPLLTDPVMSGLARDFSRLMAQEGFFSHTAPSGETFEQRIRAAGVRYSQIAENLFMSVGAVDPAERAVKSWLESTGHRGNLLQPRFTHTGIGAWRNGERVYVTQQFIRPLEPPLRPNRPLP